MLQAYSIRRRRRPDDSASCGPQLPGCVFDRRRRRRARSADRRSPTRFDDVLAGEERGVAVHRVAEQPLVGVHVVAGVLRAPPTARRACLSASRPACLMHRADRDRHLRTEAEAHVVARALAPVSWKHHRRRLASTRRITSVHGRWPERLAGAHEERHALPIATSPRAAATRLGRHAVNPRRRRLPSR